MLKKLTVANFMQHESLTMDFTEGMNVLRGANEAGKSTAYLAVMYAFWGARALPLSLEETVTWGKGPSALSVELEFEVEGASFTIKRTKAGAELTGAGVVSSGQAEVTKFVSALLKADMNTAQSVLVVGQDGIRDALAGGAGSLIETLSRMSLIDDLITSVSTHRPTGNTKVQDLKLLELQTATEVAPEADFSAEQTVLTSAVAVFEAAQADATAARAALAAVAEGTGAAQAVLSQARVHEDTRNARERLLADLTRQVAAFVQPEGADADALLAKAEAQEVAKAIGTQYAAWSKIPDHPVTHESEEAFQAELSQNTNADKEVARTIQGLMTELALAKAMAITDDSCALCGKLLADVPEVVAVNAKSAAKVAEVEARLAEARAAAHTLFQRGFALQKSLTDARAIHLAAAAVKTEYLSKREGFPAHYDWVGPQPSPKDPTDWRAAYNAAKAKQASSAKEVARQAAVRAQVAQVEAQLAVADPVLDTAAAHDVMERAAYASQLVNDAADRLTAATQAKHVAEVNLGYAQARHLSRMAAYTKAVKDRDELKTLIDAMHANNAIIKKLRDARPIVIKKLWSLVLHLVSEYFSQIRGTISVVTRGDSGFLVDGKPIGAYSGSTKDALGLAIRIALQKVFLPTVDFMLVDEGAKGMDDDREIAMLGAMSTCGFNQTVVITHSPVADTFATNLIEI